MYLHKVEESIHIKSTLNLIHQKSYLFVQEVLKDSMIIKLSQWDLKIKKWKTYY